MEINFKFNLGDKITTKESIAVNELLGPQNEDDKRIDRAIGKPKVPILFFVVSRKAEECSGGVQIHYLCTYYSPDGYKQAWFNEIELSDHPMFPK